MRHALSPLQTLLITLAMGTSLACNKTAESNVAAPQSADKSAADAIESAPAPHPDFDAAMLALVKQTVKVQELLAADSVEGLAGLAGEIKKRSSAVAAVDLPGPQFDIFRAIPAVAAPSIDALARAEDIAGARTHFKALSKSMVPWLNARRPGGYDLVWCSMYPGGWVQKAGDIRNPYYGSGMLTCGEKVPPAK